MKSTGHRPQTRTPWRCSATSFKGRGLQTHSRGQLRGRLNHSHRTRGHWQVRNISRHRSWTSCTSRLTALRDLTPIRRSWERNSRKLDPRWASLEVVVGMVKPPTTQPSIRVSKISWILLKAWWVRNSRKDLRHFLSDPSVSKVLLHRGRIVQAQPIQSKPSPIKKKKRMISL